LKRKLLYIILITLSSLQLKAQDVHFSQFYASPLYLAPSFAGSTGADRISVNFRDQWPELPGTFTSYAVAYDHYFASFNSGFGLLLLRDQAGSANLSNTTVGLNYSYNFQINRLWHFRPGLSVSYIQRGLDFNKLLFGSQIEVNQTSTPAEVPTLKTIRNIDGSVSLLSFSDKAWMGLTVDHLFEPNVTFMNEDSRLSRKYSVYAGYKHHLVGRTRDYIQEYLTGTFHFRKQGNFNQLDIGGYYERAPLIFGAWYRGIPLGKAFSSNDAISTLIGYGTRNIRLIYSYDLTISKLISHTKGAHEISLIYLFKIKRKARIKSPPCPMNWDY